MKVRISKGEIFTVFITLLVLEAGIFLSVWKPAITVYPSGNYTYGTYDDNPEHGGTSKIDTELSDGVMKVSYHLTKEYEWPYVGLHLIPKKALDLKPYDYLYIDVSVEEEQNIIVALWTSIGSDSLNLDEAQPHFYDIHITPNKKTYKVPLAELNTPSWWLAEHRIALNDLPKNLMKEVVALGFQSNYIQEENRVYTFEIRDIKAGKDYETLYAILSTLLLIASIYLILRFMWKKVSSIRILIPLKDITGKSDFRIPVNRIMAVIGDECDNADLSLHHVAEKSYLSEDQVIDTIKESFSMDFIEYLNRVRLELAKAHLRDNKIALEEIYKHTGYTSHDHFERAFHKVYSETAESYRTRKHKRRWRK